MSEDHAHIFYIICVVYLDLSVGHIFGSHKILNSSQFVYDTSCIHIEWIFFIKYSTVESNVKF